MMLKIYRVVSFLLLPFAALFGLIALFGLLVALANPPMLLPVFMLAGVVIYIICAFIFLQKAIENRQHCNPKLKDWVKVNAYVAIVFSLLSLTQGFLVFSKPDLLKEALEQGVKMQPAGSPVTLAVMTKLMRGITIVMMVFSAMLLFHTNASFKLLRQYKAAFEWNN